MYVNRGNGSFASARKYRIYVDKTGLLAAYYRKGCNSRALFEDLEIAGKSSFEEYLNKYDVIHLRKPALSWDKL